MIDVASLIKYTSKLKKMKSFVKYASVKWTKTGFEYDIFSGVKN